VLDIDSPRKGRFTETDRAGIEALAREFLRASTERVRDDRRCAVRAATAPTR
jgi:hypothetical protein